MIKYREITGIFLPQHFIVVFFFLLLMFSNGGSVINGQTFKVLRFAEDDGLTNALVKSVTIDKDGHIWAATDDGLFIFNGHEFTRILEGLPSSSVKSVFCRRNNDIIATTDLGIVAVDNNEHSGNISLLMKGSVKKMDSLLWFPKTIYEDKKGTLWFGDNCKIYCLINKKIHSYFPGIKASTNNFQRSFSFTEDGYGHLYSFAEPGFVFLLNKQLDRFEEIILPRQLANIEYALSIDKETILIATKEGIFELTIDPAGGCKKLILIDKSPETSCLFQVSDNHFYAGTWANGLYDIRRAGSTYKVSCLDEIKEKNINNIAGVDGNVWIASDNGLFLMQNNFFSTIYSKYTTNYIQSIAEFPDGRICFTDGRKVFTNFSDYSEFDPKEPALLLKTSLTTILKVLPANNGIWYSDINAHVWFEDDKGNIVWKFDFRSSGQAVFHLMADKAGNIWACQDGNRSLIRILPDFSVKKYGLKDGITSRPLVTAIDEKGKVYAGAMADTAFLFEYDSWHDRFKNLSQPLKFERNIDININDMAFTRMGVLWLGSSFGLIKYEKGVFLRMNIGGMTAASVKAVVVDRNDNVWLGNSMGLHLFVNNELLSFDERSGMPSKIINYRCLHVDRMNRIWAGTVVGLTVSSPLILPQKTVIPTIFDLLLNNKHAIRFSPQGLKINSKTFITMKVGVSDYPFKNFTVEMLLAGRDSVWQPIQKSGTIILANLEPGRYILKIRAKKYGNYLFSKTLDWEIDVNRIWYERIWVIVLLVVLLLILFWMGTQWYTKKLQRNNENLERIVNERTRRIMVQKEKIEVQQESIISKNQELEQKNIELQQAKARAEETSEAKSKFLSVMTHELRTPLNAVIGTAHLLSLNNPRPEQFEELKILRFSAENLLALINNILDFNKLDSGKVGLEQIEFNLKNLIEEIISTLNIGAKQKKLELISKIEERLPDNLIGDPLRLMQILNNLVGNALKFTKEGSVIIDLKLNSQYKDEVLIDFSVTDTGIGMSEETMNMIFQPFVQGSPETTRKYGGTGLGLVIISKLLELFGSKIQVKSEIDVGSCFYFSILFKSGSSLSSELKAKDAAYEFTKFNRQRILVVEDNKMNKLIAEKFLTDWNLDVETSEDGLAAVQKIKTEPFDLVLMDLQMPEMDGYQAAMIIRQLAIEPYITIPIIALSAAQKSDVLEIIFQSGMNDFISKPFNPVELHKKIKSFIG